MDDGAMIDTGLKHAQMTHDRTLLATTPPTLCLVSQPQRRLQRRYQKPLLVFGLIPRLARTGTIRCGVWVSEERLGESGLKISKIVMGCMVFGSSKWEGSPWTLDEEEGLELLKKAYDLGINTWDTADFYSNGASEEIVGKALKRFNIPRSKVVILSKVYFPIAEGEGTKLPVANDGPMVNQMGLSRKHIFDGVDGCLRRLGLDYIGE
ncbi:hypothetical protein NM208_g10890 [Fusarium decemcellulare]|uniref:Uncharacterized protein n=1 Tax=Fusarium decemcellulare TaxID=57161 RepID=A0ACC1RW96_9HYPO|nr:hypothetical protein NM208_g10890 [Fusarium decemcellulare]